MAENGEGNTWWSSWIQTAKEKSASVYEFVKNDLSEFTQTVQQETSSVVSTTAASLKEKLRIEDEESAANKVKRSVSTFLGSVSSAFNPVREEDESDVCIITNSEPVVLDRLQLQLLIIQRCQETYLEEPDNSAHYEDWLTTFDLDSKQDELSELMIANETVRSFYAQLVPNSVSHIVFWHRYYYRVYQLQQTEKHRLALKERAAQSTGDDCLNWDEDDEFTVKSELTAQETEKLLLDYQHECEEREREETLKNSRIELSENENENETLSVAPTDVQNEVTNSDPVEKLEEEPKIIEAALEKQEEECNTPASTEQEKPKIINVVADVTVTSSESNATEVERPTSAEKDLKTVDVKSDDKDESNVENVESSTAAISTDDQLRLEYSVATKGSEESSLSNEEEWEKDFDLEVTPEAMQKSLESSKTEDDWENWE